MTTTENTSNITRTSEQVTPWLNMETVIHEHDDYRSVARLSWVSGTTFNSHSSLDITEFQLDGCLPSRSTALHVFTATGIRAQALQNGNTALVVAVDGGHASMFLPFTLKQIIAALTAEQNAQKDADL